MQQSCTHTTDFVAFEDLDASHALKVRVQPCRFVNTGVNKEDGCHPGWAGAACAGVLGR